MKKAIITVIGKDKVGIIFGVTKILSENNVNVLDISQTIMGEYFAMIGLAIGLARALCYFSFEIHDKNASIFFPLLFSGLSIVAYFIINFWIFNILWF